MNIRTHYTYTVSTDTTEPVSTKPDCCLPDQSMSIMTIMQRYANGQSLGGMRQEIYDGDDEYYPDPKTLDPVDLMEMKMQAQQTIDEIKEKQEAKKRSKKVEQQQLPTTPPQLEQSMPQLFAGNDSPKPASL